MDKLLQDGLVGIVAGLLSTWLMLGSKFLWQSKVTPYLRAMRYQGVKVDGPWLGTSKDEEHESDSRLFLSQSAHELSGSFMFTFKNKEKAFTLDFEVKGYMWEGYITLNFIPRDKRITSYATALLKLHGGGGLLVGQMCFRDVEEEKVTAIPMGLARDAK